MSQKVIKLIGRTTDFNGKTLWEIVGNLKNFGVGRLVVRNMFARYPEPSYIKILSVEAQNNEVRFNKLSLIISFYNQSHLHIQFCRIHEKLK